MVSHPYRALCFIALYHSLINHFLTCPANFQPPTLFCHLCSGHCKSLTPEWEKVATALKGIVNVAAVDADAHGSLAQEYGVTGFPTIKLMYTDKSGKIKGSDYQGGRTSKEIGQWAMQQATKLALGRLGAKASSSSGGTSGGGSDGFYSGTSVVTLDDSNFHSQVVDSDEMWFVEFYAPWCGHCKSLAPVWKDLASSLDGKVKVGAVDCTANQQTCSEFSVGGFPTIKFFGSNKERPADYEGGRDLGSLSAYATERWAKDQPPPEVRELTDQEVWTEHCTGHPEDTSLNLKAVKPKQLCLVAFLPHILDAKASGRQQHLDMLKVVAESYKERPFAWFWAEGGAQPGLEKNLGVGGYGYPAFIALNPEKLKFASLRGGFENSAVKEFLNEVRSGRERVTDVDGGSLAQLETRSPWDGTDGEVEVEEEFSLEDLGIGGDIGASDNKDEL